MTTELNYALEESNRMDVPLEMIDGDLLMALLEESQGEEPAAGEDRLRCLMRALEAEINHAVGNGDQTSTGSHEVSTENCPLEDIFLEDVGSSTDVCAFSWMDMGSEESSSHDLGGWYIDACMPEVGMIDQLGDPRGSYSSIFYGEGSAEPLYTPLWQ
ncbi:hypothetical protein J5N97_028214 [Dioscorea zingiberensis]|uniref:Uncharacterized protein n=1 Tax=Dioscorea zingiberensis TaxID=325984 RepID=A0A9D5H4K3_9LILI|nr:hypothetical protein J5N97_028214 [Dioscorea zingiberensis]